MDGDPFQFLEMNSDMIEVQASCEKLSGDQQVTQVHLPQAMSQAHRMLGIESSFKSLLFGGFSTVRDSSPVVWAKHRSPQFPFAESGSDLS